MVFSVLGDVLSFFLDHLPSTLNSAVSSSESCQYHSGGHDGISVSFGKYNVRRLVFEDDPGYIEATMPCAGPKPHLLRWPWSDVPQQLSCEDPAVRSKFKCSASVLDDSDGGWPDKWQSLVDSCKAAPQKVLFLGLGGGYYQTYLASHCPDSETLTLEPNPTVIQAAKDYFGFSGDVVPFSAASGMERLLGEGQQYDSIVSDMGQHQLSDIELARAQKLLKPGGTFFFQWCYGGSRNQEMKLDKMMDYFVDVSMQNGSDGACVFYSAQKALTPPADDFLSAAAA
eukprot:TRINITY_DN38422_c0_g1_i2.p1 TRINITY_DN38422_c0_g1~~TRINITY_DN38422_c0_g1_i2.p1  ORF type:complete len:284 (-),score=75.43 TRINITY_DN38422_c0_g1_i2:13-864(-)